MPTALHYHVHGPTLRRGDYLVRQGSSATVGARDVTRVPTRTEAERIAASLQRAHETRAAAALAEADARAAFLRAHPTLVARQCAWQDWRDTQYSDVVRHGRAVASLTRRAERTVERVIRGEEPQRVMRGLLARAARDDQRVREAREDDAALWSRYGDLCALDRATKSAIAAQDAAAWVAALDACDRAREED